MPPVVIENPILNSPFTEPARHFRFDEDGITSEIAEGRRRSTYFIPIAKPKTKGGAQLSLPGDWVGERMTDNDFINRVREQVSAWRSARHPGITAVTRDLLAYWQAPDREKPLFFCQIEALETAIFLAEVAGNRQPWIENKLREDGQARNPGLYRIAFKMATGSGKTVVMAMLIAWQALNKLANAQDAVEALGGAARDSQRTASFSETPLDQIYSMFGDIDGRDIHLRPGVAFTKMVARQKEANPVWYVNMTPGHTWLHAAALDALRASATGSVADFIASDARRLFPFFEPMGTWPNHQREFWWEREWRVIGDFVFGRHDVALVLCPEAEIPRFTALSMGRCVDPSWSLERVVASLVGLPASAVTPFSMR